MCNFNLDRYCQIVLENEYCSAFLLSCGRVCVCMCVCVCVCVYVYVYIYIVFVLRSWLRAPRILGTFGVKRVSFVIPNRLLSTLPEFKLR